jgi:hypothetical protein
MDSFMEIENFSKFLNPFLRKQRKVCENLETVLRVPLQWNSKGSKIKEVKVSRRR